MKSCCQFAFLFLAVCFTKNSVFNIVLKCDNRIVRSFSGTLWASPTSQLPSTSGSARTRPPGCSAAATTPGWFATTAKSWPSSPRPTCDASGSCWTTTPATWPSTTRWAPSTCTHFTSPSVSPCVPCSTCGISVWRSSPVYPSPTIWRDWNPRTESYGQTRINQHKLVLIILKLHWAKCFENDDTWNKNRRVPRFLIQICSIYLN